ncbi:hypothetical protein COLO4_06366 [Corchorus olitorius]|uniref:Uncharacterized protein n=1 Tax=Corchorus olitorius TaxID=93759 RepID=A0A1R3KN65_9ROSI|nr:hypothetical protein COLO4_06366 [Corchorus olitorius]
MAFLLSSPEISSVSAKIFCNPNSSPKILNRITLLKNDGEKICSKANVTLGLKDFGVRFPVLNQSLGLYGQFSAPVKRGSKPSKEEEEKQNYYVNMGYAIRTLREEFPDLFYRELSFDIYRDDVVFKDPLNTFVGIDNYKSIFWALRFHGRIFFKALWLEIVGVWQPAENVIMVRWTVHGIPRVPWESRGRFDGTSEYKLDKEGKIFEHRVDNIALNSPPKFNVLAVEDMIRSIGCPSTPRPTYFEISSSSASDIK